MEASDLVSRAKVELQIPVDVTPGAPAMDPAASVNLDPEPGSKDPSYFSSYMHRRMAQQAQSSLNTIRVGKYLSVETGRQRISRIRKTN